MPTPLGAAQSLGHGRGAVSLWPGRLVPTWASVSPFGAQAEPGLGKGATAGMHVPTQSPRPSTGPARPWDNREGLAPGPRELGSRAQRGEEEEEEQGRREEGGRVPGTTDSLPSSGVQGGRWGLRWSRAVWTPPTPLTPARTSICQP